jgi:tousled-like kinase
VHNTCYSGADLIFSLHLNQVSYIRHVTREYTIHRDMKHPRVVQLFDVFEIGPNSFATVLEYCRGIDLDER